jgi:uncharacterized protein (TIGR00369 family)
MHHPDSPPPQEETMTNRPDKAPDNFAELLLSGKLPQPPVAKLIGFDIVEAERGRTVFEMEAGPQHANPMGTMHGGILCDIADAAMGTSFASTLEVGETFTTLEMKINFLKPVWTGTLRAVGTVVKRGKTVGMTDCEVFDEGGSLVAKASSTCLVLRGEMAQGR